MRIKIKFQIIFVCSLLLLINLSVSGETIKERKWKKVSSGWHTGGNASTSDIDKEPEVKPKPDILPVLCLFTILMAILIAIFLKRKVNRKEIILSSIC
jgi:hypothetical protein